MFLLIPEEFDDICEDEHAKGGYDKVIEGAGERYATVFRGVQLVVQEARMGIVGYIWYLITLMETFNSDWPVV